MNFFQTQSKRLVWFALKNTQIYPGGINTLKPTPSLNFSVNTHQ